jgi:hypothetical protein
MARNEKSSEISYYSLIMINTITLDIYSSVFENNLCRNCIIFTIKNTYFSMDHTQF